MTKEKEKKEEEMADVFEPSGVSLESKENEKNQAVPHQQFDQIKERLTQLENQYLRVMADYQNLQKRTAQEKEDFYKFASQKTIEALLPALDTFEYARLALKPDSKVEKIVEDFNLVFETLLKCLKEVGLELIEETGVQFDPIYHEPLHQVLTNELPDHTVMQVLKKGYMLNKKVIRPALVSVSVKQENKEEQKEK